jgi:uncharacterized membrane protein YgdD (TMEM256/DUF423 family)
MIWLKIGAASMFVTVAFGAFGAHALKQRLEPAILEIYKTAVLYQAIHALAILVVGTLAERYGKSLNAAGWLFTAGTILFSGSLYVLSLTGQKAWGAVTPLGGLCFLAGWAIFFLKVR